MAVMTLIFSTSVSIVFFISGFSKVLSLKEASLSLEQIDFIPKRLKRITGTVFPFIELTLAILLIIASSNFMINVITIILISVFILVNFQAINDRKPKSCFCFGKLIKTELGYGGLTQSLILLLFVIPNIVFNKSNITVLDVLFSHNLQLIEVFFIIFSMIISTSMLFLSRSFVDKLMPV